MRKDQVIRFFGGVAATARALEISHSSISEWGEVVPKLRAYQIEVVTKRKLKVDPKLYRTTTTAA